MSRLPGTPSPDGARRRRAVPLALLVVTLAFAAALAGCGSDSSSGSGDSGDTPTVAGAAAVDAPADLVAAAKKEGSVTFYTSAVADQMTQLADAFQKEYGIKVNAQAITTGPLATRMDAELTANKLTADVVDLSDKTLMDGLDGRGAFAPLAGLPEYTAFPAKYKTPTTATVSIQAFGAGFNTGAVKKEDLSSWEAIADPKYKGRVQILDPRTIPLSQSFFILLQKTYGDEFIRKIGALDPTIQISSTPLSQQIVSGEAQIGFPMNPSTLPPLIKQGAPIGIVQPSPTTGPVHFAGVTKGAPHPSAGKLFMNYLMSKTGQAAYNGNGFGSSAITGIPGLALPAGYESPVPPTKAQVAQIVSLLGLDK